MALMLCCFMSGSSAFHHVPGNHAAKARMVFVAVDAAQLDPPHDDFELHVLTGDAAETELQLHGFTGRADGGFIEPGHLRGPGFDGGDAEFGACGQFHIRFRNADDGGNRLPAPCHLNLEGSFAGGMIVSCMDEDVVNAIHQPCLQPDIAEEAGEPAAAGGSKVHPVQPHGCRN